MSSPSKLFTPLQLGSIGNLQHRVVLAPLTRNRASEPDLAPRPHSEIIFGVVVVFSRTTRHMP